MPNFIFSRQADNDLDLLTDYGLEVWGELQTHRYLSGLYELFQLLSQKPELGRDASKYAPLLLRYNHHSHAIFFEPINTGIYIVRVLGIRQDFSNHL
ncbi:MAG: type II toxin-antitoxin system RelE/ParE family toxin [Bacteroidota bacterium]